MAHECCALFPDSPQKGGTRPTSCQAGIRGSATGGQYQYGGSRFTLHEAEFNRHYHKRSNAETVFHMLKAKFGDKVRAKTSTAQVNEVLMKVLCHNICALIRAMHELDITPVFDEAGFSPRTAPGAKLAVI